MRKHGNANREGCSAGAVPTAPSWSYIARGCGGGRPGGGTVQRLQLHRGPASRRALHCSEIYPPRVTSWSSSDRRATNQAIELRNGAGSPGETRLRAVLSRSDGPVRYVAHARNGDGEPGAGVTRPMVAGHVYVRIRRTNFRRRGLVGDSRSQLAAQNVGSTRPIGCAGLGHASDASHKS